MFKIVCNVDKLAWGNLIAHSGVELHGFKMNSSIAKEKNATSYYLIPYNILC